ncbi:MAG: ribosome biogenesis GTP-binding protein YihA/YsxC [Limnochordia bacterium]|jgi:GTP-binding protein|nr:ribosome biogenesis GTP-binding protein YihA/YsxC [Bacillota bacterium]NLL08005.1 YihA family ribosome biogenesis GTP-binding protein [Bacillota bacterium]HBG09209.1 YihA family ribosome biogenesis GTP-binding protein [Bacillota bacterium]
MILNVHNAEFLTSAVNARGYPVHDLREIALVGRSNVGKSSLINALVNRRKFARTSGQPGRTQTINFYRVDRLCLVDLPGYGFAKVPAAVRSAWRPMIEGYLTGRPNLVGVLHLVDARHEPTKDDQVMSIWLREMDMPSVLIATKADKISRSRYQKHVKMIREALQREPVLFSAQTKQGRDEVLRIICELGGLI